MDKSITFTYFVWLCTRGKDDLFAYS